MAIPKSRLIGFFDYEGAVYHKYDPRGQNINKDHCVEILKKLQDAV